MSGTEQIDRVFAALAHPVRRAILEQCGAGRRSIAELAEPHAMSLNAVSKHIKTLESAQLVSREVDGNVHRIGIELDRLRPAVSWLEQHTTLWSESLAALKAKMEGEN